MPPKKSSVGQISKKTIQMRLARSQESLSQRERRQDQDRQRQRFRRSLESTEERESRQSLDLQRHRSAISNETPEDSLTRQSLDRERHTQAREMESDDQRQHRLAVDLQRHHEVLSSESAEERENRQSLDRERHMQAREMESDDQRQHRLAVDLQRHHEVLSSESAEVRENRQSLDRERHMQAREMESDDQRQHRLAVDLQRHHEVLSSESAEVRENRQSLDRERHMQAREIESDDQHQHRLAVDLQRHHEVLISETAEERENRQSLDRERHMQARQKESDDQRRHRLARDLQRHHEVLVSESAEERENRQSLNRERRMQARQMESNDQHQQRLAVDLQRHHEVLISESAEERENRQSLDRERHMQARRMESDDQRRQRLAVDLQNHANTRAAENVGHREAREDSDRRRHMTSRNRLAVDLNLEAFYYNPVRDYHNHSKLVIGAMDVVCNYCNAKKFPMEAAGMCCSSGKVRLQNLNTPPEPLMSLLNGMTAESKHFLKLIRSYNSSFQMTSFGANVIEERGFMPTFKIKGQVYHRAGALLPTVSNTHKFIQIYFMGDEEKEADQRCGTIPGTRRQLVLTLQRFFHQHNGLVRVFKTSLEQMPADNYKVIIRADKVPVPGHPGRFNAPSVNDVAVVISINNSESRDIIIQKRQEGLQRISETHRFYDALQYPVIFWDGQESYDFSTKLINPSTGAITNKKVSSKQFYAHRIMVRDGENHLLKCGKLFNQFLVDMYAKIESERLSFLRLNQESLRVDQYKELRDAMNNDANIEDLGQLVILPATFVGSPRHMHEYAIDAMTYVANYGKPDLFITFTCNPTWKEITENLFPGQSVTDRHDVVARVFKLKLTKLIDLVTKSGIFGSTKCHMYTIEWQKRGLPHAHILVWLCNKIRLSEIDTIISAEIPDPLTDPELFDVVTKNMIHGPCGSLNPESPCMKNGKCTKRYPRHLLKETTSGNDGYPLYRRRHADDGGRSATIVMRENRFEVDNSWVVPYNPLLSKAFHAHINVEVCSSIKSIKYLTKYVTKGSDMAVYQIGNNGNNPNDEIQQYLIGRYISSNEAAWRILGFPIHERYPAVVHLSVHLENGQRIYFSANNVQRQINDPPNTTLTAFFQLCQADLFAQTLLYPEVPQYYTWNQGSKTFHGRKQGAPVEGYQIRKADVLGRVYAVHPRNAECFYLRMLLHNVKGPKSFEDIRMIDGCLCQTFRDACCRLGLLEDDNHWDLALGEAALTKSPPKIRELFAVIISSCSPSQPMNLWEKYKELMSEDVLRDWQRQHPDLERTYNDDIFNETLIRIEHLCFSMCGRDLEELGLSTPTHVNDGINPLDRGLMRERDYNIHYLEAFVSNQLSLLNVEQRMVYDRVMDQVESENGGIIFLDAPGGTGKTFLLNLILSSVRKQGKIALAMASSGIASTLLDGGRTAHSTLKLPLNIATCEHPVCNISKSTSEGKVLKECSIIVWDEVTMAHKKSLEALNISLKDIKNKNELMGGIIVLLAGDFRQILPIVKHGGPADELDACLKASSLWQEVEKMSLTVNMRAQRQGGNNDGLMFNDILLKVGNGLSLAGNKSDEILLLPALCQKVSSCEELVSKVFPEIQKNLLSDCWLQERAILAPKNDCVLKLNEDIQKTISGIPKTYYSFDTIADTNQAVNYPIEYLNRIEISGLPSHKITLKIGVPIMLLRNINPPKLCNGTRLRVTELHPNSIRAIILTGNFRGEEVFIPRIPIISSEEIFEFKRLQFPVRLAFAMTINKAQGQSLQVVGVNLECPCFSHGQFYVACSRVGAAKNLFIYSAESKAKNVVYQKALE